MRAGRLPEILFNEDIIVVGASDSVAHTKEFRSTWKLIEFAHKFPFTEVVKISPLKKDKLMIYVYDATAKALAEKRYEDVLEYADTIETHTFSDDIEYIESYRKMHMDKFGRYGKLMQHELPEPNTFANIEEMTVYEAYLKDVEAVFQIETDNQCGACKQRLIQLKKQEIRNLKKDVIDEELKDYIAAATRGYEKWLKNRQALIMGSPESGKTRFNNKK